MPAVSTGLERFIRNRPSWARGRRLGLLCNQASVDARLRHARFLVDEAFPGSLKAIFSPQHGLFSEKQDNMKESEDLLDERLKIPVFSLYSEKRAPTRRQLEGIDLLLIDLQDCGTRVYTYIWTMLLAMRACAKNGVSVAVLDRPNPIGGEDVEGNLLESELFSFVGMARIPMRHGMTICELASFFKESEKLDLELHLVSMDGWKRNMYFDDTGLPWVLPSPNMPRLETALVYPGQVILEGTNLSEGRGTTLPFEIFGSPYLDDRLVEEHFKGLDGGRLRYQSFEPTFNKWHGHSCRGFQIHVTDRRRFRPYRFTLDLLSLLSRVQKEQFSWTPPPYEYDFWNLPADLIMGSRKVRRMVEEGAEVEDFDQVLSEDEAFFLKMRQKFLMYA